MQFLKKLFGRSTPERPLRIAAGSTAQFPVISHTFVYQELTALHEMLGADVRVYHTQDGLPGSQHAAFRYLDENHQLVQPQWETHKADYEHFRATKPALVDSLFDAIAENSAVSRDELADRFEVLMAFSYARLHEQWGADYVHSYFFYDQALCALVSAWMNQIPRGLSTYADHMMDDWPLKMTTFHLRQADVIVATSKRIRGELIDIGGAEIADKVIVKPNGVNGSRFTFVAREAVADRPLQIACVNRIEPKKGMIELAEAARILVDRGHDLRIHVIGAADPDSESSRDYGAEFERRIEELGVGEVMVRHGRMLQEELQPLLEQCDALAAPFVEIPGGDKDGIPTAILEAMATGLPVVATTAGSITEIIHDGEHGFLVPQRDPVALADAMEKLIVEPDLAPRLGKAARERFDAEFDIRVTEPRLHERVRRALATKA